MNCRNCGLCCSGVGLTLDNYLRVEVSDDDTTPRELIEYNVREDKFFMSRKENGDCVAFDSSDCRCIIYDDRPKECRDFKQGHPLCERLVQELWS